MKTINASIEIGASVGRVWEVLINGGEYGDWDPNMISVEGSIALGHKVKFFTAFSPNRAFAVRVTELEPGTRLVLTGGMPFGLFSSTRTHTLTELNPDRTLFVTEETFDGLLYPLFGRKIPDLTDSFAAFCQGLKNKTESLPSRP